ncbi:DUF300-domain-containing protein [Atractiella rhizophila]|nr:DUF300-domain-containing protein [Atractiella rhizophila]
MEQRQVIRILLMPPVYAIISFLGYRFFREYTYFEVVRDTYEAFAIAAFLVLILLYVGQSPIEQREAMMKKEKQSLPLPFCCWRYRPSKPYFLWAIKWSVLQFVFLKPLESLASVITEAFNVYCVESMSYHFAHVYILSIDFVIVSVALYGLLVLYGLAKEDLEGRRPLAKFLTIKLSIFLTFYQGFVFTVLAHYNVITATEYWTVSNISNGLNALCTTIEMVLFSLLQFWAFNYHEYKLVIQDERPPTSFWKSFLHSQNYTDFIIDFYYASHFFVDKVRGKAYTSSKTERRAVETAEKFDLADVFALDASKGGVRSHRRPQQDYMYGVAGTGTSEQLPMTTSASKMERGTAEWSLGPGRSQDMLDEMGLDERAVGKEERSYQRFDS